MRQLMNIVKRLPEFTQLAAAIEYGACPVAFTGLSPVHRAHLAAGIRQEQERPIVVVCADEAECERMAKELAAFTGEQVRTLSAREFPFHNAAVVSRLGMIDELTAQEWDLVLRHNLTANFNVTHFSLPYMKRQNFGRHIFISSATLRDMWCGANFAAATGGRYSFMRDLALEVKDYNITSNCIQPYTRTKTGQRPEGQEMLQRRSKALGIPLNKGFNDTLLPPGETNAPLGAYLCTDAGRVFNGQYFDNHLGRICIWSVPLEQRYLYKDIETQGMWTVEELEELMPASLLPSAQKLFFERV